ncbi:hypothetical protein A6770_05485 [Nostoc minutum NIES-26]|uniref:Uncharacterized protein n=1 Tax=Nostoc minutum NIES-26 TaxID=1844469 RepID=A0A367Q6A4_9NOSO|nr:hypothetical protein A6770_05485 [Nostoc minutum NIES-26]
MPNPKHKPVGCILPQSEEKGGRGAEEQRRQGAEEAGGQRSRGAEGQRGRGENSSIISLCLCVPLRVTLLTSLTQGLANDGKRRHSVGLVSRLVRPWRSRRVGSAVQDCDPLTASASTNRGTCPTQWLLLAISLPSAG